MRTNFLAAIFAAFAVGGIIIWLLWPSHVVPNSPEPAGTTNAVQSEGIPNGQRLASRAEASEPKSETATASSSQDLQKQLEAMANSRGVSLNALTQEAVIQWSNAWSQTSQQINRAIEFYGKVVDEKGSPIQGANVEFSAVVFPEDQFQTNLLSDTNGMFALNNVPGAILLVQVSKKAYEEVQGTNQNKFNYHSPPGFQSAFRPNSNSPVVFHLRKKTN